MMVLVRESDGARAAVVCRRRGSLLAEVAMSAVMLMIAMALTMKVLGWVAVGTPGLGPPPVGGAGGGQPDGAGDGPALRVGDGVVRRGDRPVSPGEATASRRPS